MWVGPNGRVPCFFEQSRCETLREANFGMKFNVSLQLLIAMQQEATKDADSACHRF